MKVAEAWKIGTKENDNGAILLVSREDRAVRIEVGYGLEGRLTDLLAGRIIDRIIVPNFREGRFDQGFLEGVEAIIASVKGEYKGSGPAPVKSEGVSGRAIIPLFVLFAILSTIGSRRRIIAAIVGAALLPLIGWLANILKFFLELFYKLVPNYGVAILLLTLLIKILFWPLTNKSYESTAKMQTLQPKIKELQAKYKANPQKMNQEMAALYKKEGVSPLGGCLPLLLQMPIFFALYNLLSTHFELRGAMFIPGWIADLSAPDSIWSFPTVDLLLWKLSAVRVLPFLMLGTTFLQSKVSQSSTPTDRNMALMTYAMPIVFFFILYNMPSGLVLYWTAQNILGIVQQLYYNNRRKRKAEEPAALSKPVRFPKPRRR